MMSTIPDHDPIALAASIPRSKDWPWYHKEIGESLTAGAGTILQDYSQIAPSNVEEHLYKIVCFQPHWLKEKLLETLKNQ